jgi:hypothetical protein
MSGSKGSSRRIAKDMNWIQIDAILWQTISKWNGKDKEKLLESISKRFNWSDKQTLAACEMHFRMYHKVKS